jgi:hypothetical protein
MIALAVIMMAAVPMSIVMSDGSDAGMNLDDGKVWGEGFTNTSDGTIHVLLRSTETAPQSITVTVKENGTELARTTETVPANVTDHEITLSFRLNGIGDHEIEVTCEPGSLFPSPGGTPLNNTKITVTVTESLWSKPSTYGAIAVIAILIVIAFYLRMRNAPTAKPDVTFTELEKRKESREDEDDKPKTPVTARRRYSGSDARPKEAEPKVAKPKEKKQKEKGIREAKPKESKTPAPPEKKDAATFTELEKQKTDKKDAAPKKEPSSGEPKKLKYVSSRRK